MNNEGQVQGSTLGWMPSFWKRERGVETAAPRHVFCICIEKNNIVVAQCKCIVTVTLT